MKLFATVGVVVVTLGMAACGGSGKSNSGGNNTATKKVKVGLAYDIGGTGDKSFNDAAAAGLEKAKKELSISTRELEASKDETDNDKYSRLKLLCDSGYNPVIAVGFVYAGDPTTGPLAKAATECPNTKFAIVDDATVSKPNVANLVFAEEQGSYLVGAAAALKSKTGHIGFVGGCLVDLIKKFQAGYEAGARAVKADIVIDVKYLSTVADKCSGFNDPAKGQVSAEGAYDAGADIVYQAAGGSGSGVFKAAKDKGKLAIGVDSDQYKTVSPDLRDVILTSMLKRVDTAVYQFVKDTGTGAFRAGTTTFDLKADGVGYALSGGKVDDIKSKLDDYKQQIIDGTITVPTKPAAG
ncbi:MAG: basic rane protein [Micromonosporaceae bacterium]|jgi:basic membrane protein A|nr:basic rane protein [Micromonosporaceae bacterium]MDT5036113.1 basic rane protein [Micromonosporaceae bacterium]